MYIFDLKNYLILGAFDYYSLPSEKQQSVVGKLVKCVMFWETELSASTYVMDIIKNGYSIPFSSQPPESFEKNNASALGNPVFVEAALQELLIDGRILQTDTVPYVVNPLSVAEGSKLRLVLDLRNVNPFVILQKFSEISVFFFPIVIILGKG